MIFQTKKLDEVCDFQNGLWVGKKSPFVSVKVVRNTNFKNNDGSLNFDDVAEIEVEVKQLQNRLLQKGDIVVERSGGGPTQPVGRVVYFENIESQFSFSNFTTRIRVKDDTVLNNKYLWLFLHSFYRSGRTELMQKKTTGIRNLTFSEYKNIEISLPPIAEQKKIVARVEKLLAKMKEAKRLRAEARAATRSLLSAELHKIFEEGKKKGWEEREFGSVVEFKTKRNLNANLPYIGMEDIESNSGRFLGSLEPRKVKSTTNYFDESRLLYGKLRPYLNKVFLPNFEGHCTTEFIPICVHEKLLTRKWLRYWISNKEIVERISKTSAGARMPRANLKEVSKFKIPLPSLVEQKKIVARLDKLSAKLKKLEEHQKSADLDLARLEQSILHQAFQGK